jgi:hypothetical protein
MASVTKKMMPAVVLLTRTPRRHSESEAASEFLRKEQCYDQEDRQADREDQADQIFGGHSFSTPRTTIARSANTPIVSSTNQKSVTTSPSLEPARLVRAIGCRRTATHRELKPLLRRLSTIPRVWYATLTRSRRVTNAGAQIRKLIRCGGRHPRAGTHGNACVHEAAKSLSL